MRANQPRSRFVKPLRNVTAASAGSSAEGNGACRPILSYTSHRSYRSYGTYRTYGIKRGGLLNRGRLMYCSRIDSAAVEVLPLGLGFSFSLSFSLFLSASLAASWNVRRHHFHHCTAFGNDAVRLHRGAALFRDISMAAMSSSSCCLRPRPKLKARLGGRVHHFRWHRFGRRLAGAAFAPTALVGGFGVAPFTVGESWTMHLKMERADLE